MNAIHSKLQMFLSIAATWLRSISGQRSQRMWTLTFGSTRWNIESYCATWPQWRTRARVALMRGIVIDYT